MKKITIILALVMVSFSLFADGDKTKSLTSLKYNPNPSSGDVGQALNFYIGTGTIQKSGLGFNIGADYEIPMINENLTLGPGVGIGFASYSGVYRSSTTGFLMTGTSAQFSIYGSIVAHYYFDWLIPNMPDEFDVFITSNTGAGLVTYSNYYDNQPFVDFGTAVGGRWNFSDNLSMYAQAGYGTSSLLFGLSYKM